MTLVNPLDSISPAELAMDVINRLGPPDIAPAGCIVGPASDAQQQAGVISAVAAGLPVIDLYGPIQWSRVQLRCLSSTLDDVDIIAQRVYLYLHTLRNRTIGRMASTDRRYLIHAMNPIAGPSQHYDTPETWEALVFVEMMIGTEPIEI